MKKKLTTLLLTAALMLAARPAKAVLAYFWLTNGPSGVPSMPGNPWAFPTVETNTLHYLITPTNWNANMTASNAEYYFWGQQSFGTNGGLLYTNIVDWLSNTNGGQAPDTNVPPSIAPLFAWDGGSESNNLAVGTLFVTLQTLENRPGTNAIRGNGSCWGGRLHGGAALSASLDCSGLGHEMIGEGLNPFVLAGSGDSYYPFSHEIGKVYISRNDGINQVYNGGGSDTAWFQCCAQFPDYEAASDHDLNAIDVAVYGKFCDGRPFGDHATLKIPKGYIGGSWNVAVCTGGFNHLVYTNCNSAIGFFPTAWDAVLSVLPNEPYGPTQSDWCGNGTTNIYPVRSGQVANPWWTSEYPTNGASVVPCGLTDDGDHLKFLVVYPGAQTNFLFQSTTNMADPIAWQNEAAATVDSNSVAGAMISIAGRTNLFIRAIGSTNTFSDP